MMGELSGYHAALTDAGAAKLDRSARANLQPGVDYKIREEGGEDWLPLGHGALARSSDTTGSSRPGAGADGEIRRELYKDGADSRQADRPAFVTWQMRNWSTTCRSCSRRVTLLSLKGRGGM